MKNIGDIITEEELKKEGCSFKGMFANLRIYSSKTEGYLLEEKGNDFKVYFIYKREQEKQE